MTLPKACAACGREIEWRSKWKNRWDEIRYCSAACRRNKPAAIDQKVELTILELLRKPAAGGTICPSEAARAAFPEDRWRDEMERTRRAARRLVAKGQIEIHQKGRMVKPSRAKGPIRLKLRSEA
jgi:hypothetical protein